jgi:hypothetical protein
MYQATSMTRCERACRVLHTFAFFFVAGKISRDEIGQVKKQLY